MNFYSALNSIDVIKKYPDLIRIIRGFLMNSRGLIEGQKINKKTFDKYNQDWSKFERYGIENSQGLYDVIMNTSSICPECNKGERRFVGLSVGYKDICFECSKQRNWIISVNKKHTNEVPLSDILEFVKDKNGNYSTTKIKKLSDNSLTELKNQIPFITWEASVSEYLYCYEHGITSLEDLPICQFCETPVTRFYAGSKGYWKYHKGECANKKRSFEYTEISKSKLRKARSSSVLKRMNNYPKGYSLLKEFNMERYLEVGEDFITLKCPKNHEYDISSRYQGSFRCPKCFPKRSKTQNEIFDFCFEFDPNLLHDNRKMIDRKEIDILSHSFEFGVEYNSQNFHSSGKNKFLLNTDKNYHLEKTLLMEEKNYQLFHIFSSEWLDENKRNIWKSILENKFQKTSRKIHARKCEIREITSKELRDFSNENHIQGHVNASIKLGLFFEDELIQIMSFGIPRQSIYKGTGNYELIRMCSKIGTSVIGGASKLLKYFERTYKPKLILSYANRRWSYSKENVYMKLGFEYKGASKPNYFYFRGDDNSFLESRVKYQKHKLITLDETKEYFSSDLPETEIMFIAGYRKIYDSGNLIYTKVY